MDDKDAIIKTIRAYNDCLPRDPAAAARYCNEPFMVIGDDGWKIAALTIRDPAAVVRLE
jgi:hypothetical protein